MKSNCGEGARVYSALDARKTRYYNSERGTRVRAVGIPPRAGLRRETGPYKDNEVKGTRDSLQVVSSAAFQQDPVTFYVRA